MSKVKIKNVNEKTIKEKFWVWCAIISMTVYVVWRIFFTVPDHNIYGWVATICGIFFGSRGDDLHAGGHGAFYTAPQEKYS